MAAASASKIRAFVPGGRDYALSKRFYEALGFTIDFDAGDVAGLSCDAGGFLLQNYYHKDWAGNFMMQWVVEDLDAWWTRVSALDLAGRFGVQAPRPPAMQPWGLTVAYLFGPCGELWHVVQA
jgi:hypothetical protein